MILFLNKITSIFLLLLEHISMEARKELRVSQYNSYKKVIFEAKEYLLSIDSIDITGGTNSSGIAARAVESLVRLGYVTIENVQTLTIVENGRRIIKIVITVKKTSNFKKLYDENEEMKKKKMEERAAETSKDI